MKLLQALFSVGVISAAIYGLVACSTNSRVAERKTSVASAPQLSESGSQANENQELVGGWAPVFFQSLDKVQLDSIADGINQHRIKRTVISYPTRMQTLATRIQAYLQDKTQQPIPLKSIELKDTSQVKYDLTQVIVTLYFN